MPHKITCWPSLSHLSLRPFTISGRTHDFPSSGNRLCRPITKLCYLPRERSRLPIHFVFPKKKEHTICSSLSDWMCSNESFSNILSCWVFASLSVSFCVPWFTHSTLPLWSTSQIHNHQKMTWSFILTLITYERKDGVHSHPSHNNMSRIHNAIIRYKGHRRVHHHNNVQWMLIYFSQILNPERASPWMNSCPMLTWNELPV